MHLKTILFAACLAVQSSTASAQLSCTRVTIVTPYAAGLTGTIGHVLADKLRGILGVSVVVEPRPGAGGTLGTLSVIRSAPDGCTLIFGVSSNLIQPFALRPSYDAQTELTPVAFVATSAPPMLVVKSGSFDSLDTLVRASKNARGLTYATNNRNLSDLAALQLMQMTGINALHVPASTEPQALELLLSNSGIDFAVAITPAALPFVRSGVVQALVHLTNKASPYIVGIPTLRHLGIDGYIDLEAHSSIFAPKGTPPGIVEALARAIERVQGDPDFAMRLGTAGIIPRTGGPKEVADWLEKETNDWAVLIERLRVEKN